MSNPLNEQIAKLLKEILELERERDKHYDELDKPSSDKPASIQGLSSDLLETRDHRLAIEALTREIDERRQELISMELLMLDNSIKDLRSTTTQVDGSVKSLQETTKEAVRSSIKLERLTLILIFVTVLLGIIGIYQITITLAPTYPIAGLVGIIVIPILIVYLVVRMSQRLR